MLLYYLNPASLVPFIMNSITKVQSCFCALHQYKPWTIAHRMHFPLRGKIWLRKQFSNENVYRVLTQFFAFFRTISHWKHSNTECLLALTGWLEDWQTSFHRKNDTFYRFSCLDNTCKSVEKMPITSQQPVLLIVQQQSEAFFYKGFAHNVVQGGRMEEKFAGHLPENISECLAN